MLFLAAIVYLCNANCMIFFKIKFTKHMSIRWHNSLYSRSTFSNLPFQYITLNCNILVCLLRLSEPCQQMNAFHIYIYIPFSCIYLVVQFLFVVIRCYIGCLCLKCACKQILERKNKIQYKFSMKRTQLDFTRVSTVSTHLCSSQCRSQGLENSSEEEKHNLNTDVMKHGTRATILQQKYYSTVLK